LKKEFLKNIKKELLEALVISLSEPIFYILIFIFLISIYLNPP